MDEKVKKVCIAGSFNQWSHQSHCMKKDKNAWTLSLSLPPGRYPYLFLIDDRISELDPGTPLTEENGFGTKKFSSRCGIKCDQTKLNLCI